MSLTPLTAALNPFICLPKIALSIILLKASITKIKGIVEKGSSCLKTLEPLKNPHRSPFTKTESHRRDAKTDPLPPFLPKALLQNNEI